MSIIKQKNDYLLQLLDLVLPVLLSKGAAEEDDLGPDYVCAGEVCLPPAVGLHGRGGCHCVGSVRLRSCTDKAVLFELQVIKFIRLCTVVCLLRTGQRCKA
jgi:hypothetical protein